MNVKEVSLCDVGSLPLWSWLGTGLVALNKPTGDSSQLLPFSTFPQRLAFCLERVFLILRLPSWGC